MMNQRRAGAVLTFAVAWAAPLLAQEPEASVAGAASSPVAQSAECAGDPLAVVAQVLSLAPEQIQALAQLLRQREETVAPILQEIARREQRIHELITSGGDPAAIGSLVVEIHELRLAAETAQRQFLARFQSLLGTEQRQRLDQVRLAAQLQPVLPAFHGLRLF